MADRCRPDAGDYHHGADAAVRTFEQGLPCQRLETMPIVRRRRGVLSGRCHPDQRPAECQLPRSVVVGEQAIVADAMEAIRQHMDQEPADELIALQGHCLLAVPVTIVLPAETDLAVVYRQQSVVGDGDAVGPDCSRSRSLQRIRSDLVGLLGPEQRRRSPGPAHEIILLCRRSQANQPGVG